MNIEQLKQFLIYKWSYGTCSPNLKNEWCESNSSLEQCVIITLIVNDFFGGNIMRCTSLFGTFYYNVVNGDVLDLMDGFFDEILQYEYSEEVTREQLLANNDIKNKYEKVLYDLKQTIRQIQGKQYKLINSNGQEYLSSIPGTLGGNKKLKIYGRLDCPSAKRWIEKGYYISNRVFFKNEDIAVAAGYRPCAVCMPDKYREWRNEQLLSDDEILIKKMIL